MFRKNVIKKKFSNSNLEALLVKKRMDLFLSSFENHYWMFKYVGKGNRP